MTSEYVDWVRREISGPMCAAYLLGLERGHLTASQMHIMADKDTARAYAMGLHERNTGKPEAA